MPIFIPFLIKGAILAGKAIVASKKVSVVAKGTSAAIHSFGATTVVSTAATGCVVIGAIAWSVDRVKGAEECYEAWENREWETFATKFSSLLTSLNSVVNDTFMSSYRQLLITRGHDEKDVLRFCKEVGSLGNDMIKDFKRPA